MEEKEKKVRITALQKEVIVRLIEGAPNEVLLVRKKGEGWVVSSACFSSDRKHDIDWRTFKALRRKGLVQFLDHSHKFWSTECWIPTKKAQKMFDQFRGGAR